jgi:hypothetical protein
MFDAALHRAADRAPGSAARCSIARLREFSQALSAIPIPEPDGSLGPIRIGQGEYWCSLCGTAGHNEPSTSDRANRKFTRRTCARCGSSDLVPAAEILRSDEFYIAS